MRGHPKTIFFDVGNTLLFPDRVNILAPLRERTVVSIEHLHAVERTTKRKFDQLLQETGSTDHGFWFMFYSQLLEELGIDDSVLHSTLVSAMRNSSNWCDIRPGTREVLQRLAQSYRLGVISNADGKVASVLARCGIADQFRNITDSGVIGYEKPHPAIFRSALKELQSSAEESLYVGDVCSVDYMGATSAGMQAVLFDVAGAYRDLNLPRVGSLEELETKLNS